MQVKKWSSRNNHIKYCVSILFRYDFSYGIQLSKFIKCNVINPMKSYNNEDGIVQQWG